MGIKIAGYELTFGEAAYLLEQHREGGYFDACGQVVLYEREDNGEGIQ